MGLRASFLRAVQQDLPTPASTLTEPSVRWDELLGGRTGPNDWAHYERSKGTTCIIFVNGEAISAGFPEDMVVTGPTPGGAGTVILQTQHAGAKARGWYHTPERGVLPSLRPGDIYEINHTRTDGLDGTHEGIILSVTPSADGQSLEIETADGGQGSWDKQEASRQKRTLTLSDGVHPVAVKSKYSSGWLQSWISVGGDAEDGLGGGALPLGGSSASPSTFDSPVPAAPVPVAYTPGTPVSGGGDDGPDPLAVGAVFAGVGLLLLGLALRTKPVSMNPLLRMKQLWHLSWRTPDGRRHRAKELAGTPEMAVEQRVPMNATEIRVASADVVQSWDQDFIPRLPVHAYPGRINSFRVSGEVDRSKPVNLTFNFPYKTGCWNDEDATRRRRLEERLTKAGVEMTGMGSMMGCGKHAGMDIDVRTRTPRATETLVRRLAERNGLKVGEVRPWS